MIGATINTKAYSPPSSSGTHLRLVIAFLLLEGLEEPEIQIDNSPIPTIDDEFKLL